MSLNYLLFHIIIYIIIVMATYETFLKNVDKYHIYEIIASEKICLLHNKQLLKFNNDYRYDFKTSDKIKYEVKTDVMSLKTNNLFIEFESYRKPSGISSTKAHYYIFSDTIDYYLIETQKLKIILCNIENKKIVSTKDKQTFGYLIRKEVIFTQCTKI